MAERANGIKRRKVLAGLAATSAMGLAGCGSGNNDGGDGGDGGDGNDLGERVPDIAISFQAGRGIYTDTATASRGPVLDALEAIGMGGEFHGVAFANQSSSWVDDTREYDVISNFHGNAPSRLDPHEFMRRNAIDWAGGDGNSNIPNYASCEYSEPAHAQISAGSEEERREMVNAAQEIFNNDYAGIPYLKNVIFTAARTDEIEPRRTGAGVFTQLNPIPFVYSTPRNGDTFTASIDPTAVNVQNPFTISSSTTISFWTHIPHSSLLEYDENFEIQNMLASDYTVENDARTFTFTLADATFHNGDPITPEDVKFTFEHFANNSSSYPQAEAVPYESINVLDDSTVEFNFEEPFLPFIGRIVPKWGILHKASWEARGDDPEAMDFFENPIGSGPFVVENLERGQFMELSPHDGHPVHSPEHGIFFQAFRDQNAIFQAFRANEIQVATALSLDFVERIENEIDNAEVYALDAFTPYTLYPQFPSVPMKFKAIRQAWGTALNRDLINQLAFGGRNDIVLHAFPFTDAHPWVHPNPTTYTDNPQGEPEVARQILEDAGFGWDNNGRLRFPADADLEPLWPAGEEPSPDDFPCINDYQ